MRGSVVKIQVQATEMKEMCSPKQMCVSRLLSLMEGNNPPFLVAPC